MSITGRLEITVYEARDLHKEDLFKMDPYTKIELNKETFKTKTHKKGGTNPKWEQAFLFNVKGLDEKAILHFQVFDEDVLSDDKIGRADIPLSGVAQHTDKKDGAWIQLVDFDNFKKIAGYVRIGVKFDGTGWPVKKEEEKPHPQIVEKPPPPPVYAPPVGYVPPPKPVSEPVYTPPPTTTTTPTAPVYVIPQPVYVQPTQPYVPSQPVPVYVPVEPPKEIKIPEKPRETHKDVLENNHSLFPNERLTSSDGRFVCAFQGDSNLVLYEGSRPYWASKTQHSGGQHVILQTDNNLVIYDHKGVPVWHSNTYGQGTPGTGRLVMQTDGNLVLYAGSTALWSTETAQPEKKSFTDTLTEGGRLQAGEKLTSSNGQYVATFQSDGNFVVYEGTKPLWNSGTHGSGASWVTLQTDDNLVVYDSWNRPKWASNTVGKGTSGGCRLVMQTDGNLVLYSGSTPLWSSQGGSTEVKHGDTLAAGGRLNRNQSLTSRNGKFIAILQSDGNFVLYHGTRALWASSTNNTGASFVTVQSDGNLVVYDDASKPHWHAGTNGRNTTGEVRLVIQDDGNLVLYSGSTATWASNTVQVEQKRDTLQQSGTLRNNEQITSSDGRYRAVMQGDGNFVVYGGSALWASSTFGSGLHLTLQTDNNLVVYEGTAPKWNSGTNGKGSSPSRLVMQTDGNLVLYDAAGSPLWHTSTSGRY
jgi:hypothetical protein